MTVVAVAILQTKQAGVGGLGKALGYKVVCNHIILLGSYLITRVLITL